MRLAPAIALLLLAGLLPEAAKATECLAKVRELIGASDSQTSELWHEVTWSDGHETSLRGEERGLHDIYFGGPDPKYRTFVREIRTVSLSASRQQVSTKEITQHLRNHEYTGEYQVAKRRYLCERRDGHWKILRVKWLTNVYGENPVEQRRWHSARNERS